MRDEMGWGEGAERFSEVGSGEVNGVLFASWAFAE